MENIFNLLDNLEPLTGKELLEKTNMDEFTLWKACNDCNKIISKPIGKSYLRLDKQVEDFARLSPSILRQFYGYTVIGTEKNLTKIHEKAELLHQEIIGISKAKFQLAKEVIKKIVESQKNPQTINTGACFIIAGDVAYEMSHLEPRPESSTGELVKGSDLDIVVVTEGLPDSIIESIDASIYDQKNFLLKNPSYNEEIDYIIKDISTVEKQLKFDSFESMIAAKILHEGKFLYGSMDIFHRIKKMLHDEGIYEKIAALEEKALIDRNHAISTLLKCAGSLSDEKYRQLFYTEEEKEEFF